MERKGRKYVAHHGCSIDALVAYLDKPSLVVYLYSGGLTWSSCPSLDTFVFRLKTEGRHSALGLTASGIGRRS